jgi:flagellar assembly protein FliH
MTDLVSRIPAEDIETCQAWKLQEMPSGKTIPAVKNKIKKDKPLSTPKKPEVDNESVTDEKVESIEDVTLNSEPMSADNLQKITETAEKEGYDVGYKEGFELGKKAGEEEGIKEGLVIGEEKGQENIKESVKNLEKVAEALLLPIAEEQEKLEQQMLDIICHLTRLMVKRELNTDSSVVMESVNQCLSLLQNKENSITLFLNEQDIDRVKSGLLNNEISITYEIDAKLLPGGCRVENKSTAIDVSIEKQLDQLLDDFTHQRYTENSTDETVNDNDEASNKASNHTNDDDEKKAAPVDESDKHQPEIQ